MPPPRRPRLAVMRGGLRTARSAAGPPRAPVQVGATRLVSPELAESRNSASTLASFAAKSSSSTIIEERQTRLGLRRYRVGGSAGSSRAGVRWRGAVIERTELAASVRLARACGGEGRLDGAYSAQGPASSMQRPFFSKVSRYGWLETVIMMQQTHDLVGSEFH